MIRIKELTKYKTVYGDTFDMIAYKLYGDEMKESLIRKYNPDYSDVIFFDANEVIWLPTDIEEIEEDNSKAPWRQ